MGRRRGGGGRWGIRVLGFGGFVTGIFTPALSFCFYHGFGVIRWMVKLALSACSIVWGKICCLYSFYLSSC